mmetsp:Transcript_26319/g.43937  ORF Transcript_26319/g.43937 Transcript_26319/m.43937 type:complete len:555 (-) Transcript_26319:75-1739(-)
MTSFLNNIGKRKKSPDQLVASSRQAMECIIGAGDGAVNSGNDNNTAAMMETLGKNLIDIKNILYGHIDSSVTEIDEEKIQEISRCMQSEGLLLLLINNLDEISFEARKDTALIFNNLIRKDVSDFVSYVAQNATSIVDTLVKGYGSIESALSYGSMLRECIRHEPLTYHILYSSGPPDHHLLWLFFDVFVLLPNFEVASDAFNTLRDLLTTPRHKHLSDHFLEEKCEVVLDRYDTLLQSDNYVTRRRSLKLLSELLLDRSHYAVMINYISNKRNLKTIMTLLRHKSAQIQFETFHVFKIFVANPNKTPEIEAILSKNRVKLVAYLENFHNDNEDPQFVDEKRLLIDTLRQLQDASSEPPPPNAAATVGKDGAVEGADGRDSGGSKQKHHHHHHRHQPPHSREGSADGDTTTTAVGAEQQQQQQQSYQQSHQRLQPPMQQPAAAYTQQAIFNSSNYSSSGYSAGISHPTPSSNVHMMQAKNVSSSTGPRSHTATGTGSRLQRLPSTTTTTTTTSKYVLYEYYDYCTEEGTLKYRTVLYCTHYYDAGLLVHSAAMH